MDRTSRVTEFVVLNAEKTQYVSMNTYKQTTSEVYKHQRTPLGYKWDLNGVARPLTRPDRMLNTSGVYQRILDRSFR